MKIDIDEHIASLLQVNAPPERDPVFRIKVLERRERQRFHRRSLAMVGTALSLTVIAVAGYSAGVRIAEAASIALLGISVAAPLAYAPGILRTLRRFWHKSSH
jgi:hypothetical protein